MLKKKLFTGICLLSLLSGCLLDDLHDCPGHPDKPVPPNPPEETTQFLYFRYTGDGDTDLLTERISCVDMYVFDSGERLVSTLEIDAEALRARHGVSIDLPAGNYTVVCLGNAGERTQVSDLTTCDFHMMFFAHPGYFMNDESMLTGNDPLYHGDLRFRVEDGKSLKDTVDFNSSHLKVYVEVKGYGTTEYGKDGGEPDIRLHNMPCRVFFDNRICPQRRTYHPEVGREGAQDMYVGKLCTFRLDGNHPAEIALYSGAGTEPFYTVDVADFLKRHPEVDITKQEAELSMRIEFRERNANVTITVPQWGVEDVYPDVGFE